MKNFKLFKRSALLLAVVVLAAVLTVGAIAGTALLSDEGSTEYGEQYAGVQVGTSGKVSLKFYYSTYGTAEEFVAEVIDPETNERYVPPATRFKYILFHWSIPFVSHRCLCRCRTFRL